MKQFRVIFIKCNLTTEWLNADEWSVEDMMQFLEFGDIQFEYR